MMLSIKDVVTIADGLDHPECIAVHPDGSIWAGGEAGQIYRICPDGEIIQKADTKGFILGIAFSPDCSWLAICDSKFKCVWKLDLKNNSLSKFANGTPTVKMKIPNYAVFDDEGNLYVSDSGGFNVIEGRIFKFTSSGYAKVWHNGPFNFANGMAISKDKRYLYVVCTWLPGIERIEIDSNGNAGIREVFHVLTKTCPDGIAFDDHENLYVSCYAPNVIYRIDKNNQHSVLLEDWEGHILSNPTNLAFGGSDFRNLYIANLGRWHIGRIKMNIAGLKLSCHKNL